MFAIPQQYILPFCLPAFRLAGRGENKRGLTDKWDGELRQCASAWDRAWLSLSRGLRIAANSAYRPGSEWKKSISKKGTLTGECRPGSAPQVASLLQHNELLDARVRTCTEPVEVHPARKVRRIQSCLVIPRLDNTVLQCCHFFPQNIIDLQCDVFVNWQRVADRCQRVERVGIVL